MNLLELILVLKNFKTLIEMRRKTIYDIVIINKMDKFASL